MSAPCLNFIRTLSSIRAIDMEEKLTTLISHLYMNQTVEVEERVASHNVFDFKIKEQSHRLRRLASSLSIR